MYHPETMHELAKLRSAEERRGAENQRLARLAKSSTPTGAIDAVPFRQRLTRLFGAIRPATSDGTASSGA